MAPRKERTEKSGPDNGSLMVLEYLKKQSRPYSAADISSNLHNKVTKTNTAKYLKELHESQKIECRVSGKQIVYHALQAAPSADTSQEEDLAAIDEKLDSLHASLAKLKASEKKMKHQLLTSANLRSLEELQATYAALEAQKQGLLDRIGELKAAAANKDLAPVCEAERKIIEADYKKWTHEVKLRALAVKNLWNLVRDIRGAEGDNEISSDEFWENIGCEGSIPK